MRFLKRKKQETKLPYDLAVPILGLHLGKKKKIYKYIYIDTHTHTHTHIQVEELNVG